MATLRRRIVTQFCRGLEAELVLGRHRARLEQPKNDILGRRAPGNGPEDISLPVIDLYTYIGGDYRRISRTRNSFAISAPTSDGESIPEHH